MARVLTGATLGREVQSQFMDVWYQDWAGEQDSLGNAMQMAVPTDVRKSVYGWRETMPYPRLWRRGESIPTEGTRSRQIEVVAQKFGMSVEWLREDRMDNRVGDVLADAASVASNYASASSRAFFQILSGSGDYLPFVPNAADGKAMFATVRYGQAGGNIVSGAQTTAAEVRTLFFLAMDRFALFQNPKGQPLFNANDGSRGDYDVFFSADRHEIITEAFKAELVKSETSGGAGAAGVQNLILATGSTVRFHFSQRISGLSFYIHKTCHHKSIKEIMREQLQSTVTVLGNNARSNRTHMESVEFFDRRNYGITEPFDFIRADST